MTEPTDAPPREAPPPVHRRLTRSRSDRVIGGVCGGLGEYTGIDPVVFRVLLVASSLVGGMGVVAYLVAWVAIPEAPAGEAAPAERLRRPARLDVLLAVVLGLAVLHLLDRQWDHRGPDLDLTFLLLVGIGVWWWARDRRGSTGIAGPEGGGTPPAGRAPDTPTAPAAPPPDPWLGRLTFSAVVLTAGIFAALGAADVDVDLTVALATCLLVAAVGLLASAWYGHRWWLLPLCTVLAAATVASGVLDVPLAGGAGQRHWIPESVTQLRDEYRLGAGEASLDLSRLDGLRGDHEVEASVGLGKLRVILPDDVDVSIRARAGAGQLDLLGRQADGLGVELDHQVRSPGTGRLELELRVGAGQVEVVR